MADQDYTFEQLKHMNVEELRKVAEELDHPDVQGYTQMHKEHLLEALCHAMHIDMHAHHEVVGIDKRAVKDQIQELKKQRDAALEAHDSPRLKKIRREIHALKRSIRRATV